MTKRTFFIVVAISFLSVLFNYIYFTHPTTTDRNNFIPDTISLEAQETLKNLFKLKIYTLSAPHSEDGTAWREMNILYEKAMRPKNIKIAAKNQVSIEQTTIGNIPVLDIRPKNWKDNHKLIIYIHGGAYTLLSPETTLLISAPISRVTGQRILAIRYTTAPFADWQKIQSEVITVVKSLLAQGYRMQDIVMLGDSAGGGLAMSTVIQLRDHNLGMPAALVLLSPWSDLTTRGESMQTLANADPILDYDNMLMNSALAYAHGLKLNDPRISPLYADFRNGFPPTLIIEGTRCIFLSSSVRLYQALDGAQQEVLLDMHEGMWHGFLDAPTPEAETAIKKIAMFIQNHQLSVS